MEPQKMEKIKIENMKKLARLIILPVLAMAMLPVKAQSAKNTLAPAIDKNDATPNKHNEPNKYLSKENFIQLSIKI